MREVSASLHYMDGEMPRIMADLGVLCLRRRPDQYGGGGRRRVGRTACAVERGGLDGDRVEPPDHGDDRFHEEWRAHYRLYGASTDPTASDLRGVVCGWR